jgi:hypothetical protein
MLVLDAPRNSNLYILLKKFDRHLPQNTKQMKYALIFIGIPYNITKHMGHMMRAWARARRGGCAG